MAGAFMFKPVPSAATFATGVALQNGTVVCVYRAATQVLVGLHCCSLIEQRVAFLTEGHGGII
jgi:hypothetical protein